jgi:hypothetical protein
MVIPQGMTFFWMNNPPEEKKSTRNYQLADVDANSDMHDQKAQKIFRAVTIL